MANRFARVLAMWPFKRAPARGIRTAEPYWLQRDGRGDAGKLLESHCECDIAVVGGGITGALIADALVSSGADIILLDAREPGFGSTAATTALLQYEIDVHLIELTRLVGAERALRAYRACAESFALLETRFGELIATIEYERRPSLYLAHDENVIDGLRAELKARASVGFQVEWLDGNALVERYGIHRPGGILSALGAQLDPLRFTRALLSSAARHGVRQFCRSRVTKIDFDTGKVRLKAGEREVRASHVVIAGGYESLEFLPLEVAFVKNTFALVTAPLPVSDRAWTLPLVWESARPYIYLRSTRDGRLLVGGADIPFKSPLARDAALPRQIRQVGKAYEKMFERELPPIDYAWGGSFAETRDGLPYIGRVPGHDPRVQFALCYGGNGITYSVHAGHIIRAAIEGRAHPLADVFGFARLGERHEALDSQGGKGMAVGSSTSTGQ